MTDSTRRLRTRQEARVRISILALVFFLLGISVSVLWFHKATGRAGGHANAGRSLELSDSTKAVLQRVNSPIVIRFYTLLDAAIVSPATKAFAARVGDLLSEYEREGHGEIEVNRIEAMSDATANAASADGLRPFNLDKGAACYLGIVISGNGQKEALSQLSPEWEGAVQFDLTRAIERVSKAKPSPSAALVKSRTSPAVIAEVKRAIPNLDAISLEQGTEILRENALREFATTAQQMEVQVKEAQQRLAQAQKGGSAAEQQAAMKNLQQTQAEQADKIKQIAARLQDQIAALQQIKRQ